MPIYEYKCQSCERLIEVMQRMSEAPLTTCEDCGGELKKQISAPAFQFKGTGWYVTDYADKGKGTKESGKGGESKGGKSSDEGGSSSEDSSSKDSSSKDSSSKDSSSKEPKSESSSSKESGSKDSKSSSDKSSGSGGGKGK